MNPLDRKTLGSTGLEVTRLGLGCASLGGLYGDISEEQATQVVQRALTLGLNLVDTAPLYGAGKSERRLGGQGRSDQKASSSCSAACAGAHKEQAEKLHKDLIKDRRRHVSWSARIVLLLLATLVVVAILEYLGFTNYVPFIPFE